MANDSESKLHLPEPVPGYKFPVTPPQNAAAAEQLAESAAIVARLRAPDGCHWDREQTFDTLKRNTLEETYEVFDAIERRDWQHLKEELGDYMLQGIFYAQMASEGGHFSLTEVLAVLNEKLVRRHPHIFAGAEATDTNAVLRNWEIIKRKERAEKAGQDKDTKDGAEAKPVGMLDDVGRAMPAMLEAHKLGSRAAKIGFDWPDAAPVLDKLAEELEELRQAIANKDAVHAEEEFGDLLFAIASLARHMKVDTEFALRAANVKFRRRFAQMEQLRAAATGSPDLTGLDAEALESLWQQAKATE
jgi:XTP/dITP diphosphohydrolase/ATP diphosphatase